MGDECSEALPQHVLGPRALEVDKKYSDDKKIFASSRCAVAKYSHIFLIADRTIMPADPSLTASEYKNGRKC